MQLRIPSLVPIVAFVFGLGGYVSCPELARAESNIARASTVTSVPLLPGARVRVAADKVVGFNLLSNNPPLPDVGMQDVDGKPVVFEQFKGKVVLFNLWATWCPPCIREMPALNALQAQYKDRGFVVVPVASGRQGEEEPSEFLRKHGLSELTTYYDQHDQYLRLFDLETLPITFVIDRKGNMRGGVIGMLDWHSAEAKALIEAFLNEDIT